MFSWFQCWLRSHHRPVRHPLGGFRCSECGAKGLDLSEMGFQELGSLSRSRKFMTRHGGLRRLG
jgi:hypothetical protein